MVGRDFTVEYTRTGDVHDPAQVDALLEGCRGASSLLVLTHGWNNDKDEATRLYDRFLASLDRVSAADPGPESGLRVMRVLWPSKKFALEHLIPGGGAASAGADDGTALQESLALLNRDPELLGGDEASPAAANLDHALALVDQLEDSAEARREYVLGIRAALNPDEAHDDDASAEFFALDPEELFDRFAQEVPLVLPVGEGGAASLGEGGAAFLGDLVSGVRAAARRIANYATYYQMKSRAGAVGRGGLAATLGRVSQQHPGLPLHLVGHSFGGRVVVSAAAGLAAGNSVASMSLLQAAFSHNGLAERFDGTKDGHFRSVVTGRRISGPVVITHTKRDLAVGVAYPLASRIAQDNSAALGDENDPYGGMGRNGAQHTPEVDAGESVLRSWTADPAYRFTPGRIYNLRADGSITGHNDITGEDVANAVLQATRVAAAPGG